MRKQALLTALLAAVVAVPAAAPAADAAKPRAKPAKKAKLKAFRSCAQLVRYGRRHAARGEGAVPPEVGLPFAPRPLPPTAPGAAPPAAAPLGGREDATSPTNVQEPGIDEPDVVKAKGSRIFTVVNGRLHAADARGPGLLGSLDLAGSDHQLLLYRKRLLVLARAYENAPAPGPLPAQVVPSPPAPAPAPGIVAPEFPETRTLLIEVDVSNPAAMRVLRTEEVPGNYLTSRLAGRSARVVISSPPRAFDDTSLRPRLRGWMPSTTLVDGRRNRRVTRRLTSCRGVRRPAAFSGLDMLSVLTVDLTKGLPAVDTDAVMAGGEIAYASSKALYVATQSWTPQPAGPATRPPSTFTAIHKFDISDPDRARYTASGAVPGYLLNQFSLSERAGVLRVASTQTPLWWAGAPRQDSEGFVTTLAQRRGALLRLGQVGGLGRGERIYAVRFIDDTGFVVTFRQTDPLYTVDLSKARRPRVLGELRLLGYSAYLHPIGRDLLLGVGQDATEEGRRLGTQLSLFDVSNLRSPRRLHQRAVGLGSSSEVEYDHHAFLWWAPAKLAVIPVQVYAQAPQPFLGAVGFRVSRAGGIGEAGRASHPTGAQIRRSLVANGRLFTLSDDGLGVNDLGTLAGQGWLPFK